MGFRFRRSIRLGKGLRINLSKTGASMSIGRPGATVNVGPRGTSATAGVPGSGFSYRFQNRARTAVGPAGSTGSPGASGTPSAALGCLGTAAFLLAPMLLLAGVVTWGVIVLGAAALLWYLQIQRNNAAAEARAAEEARRRADLTTRFGTEVCSRILAHEIWLGQTDEQVRESRGEPAHIDEKVMKTKTREVWKYDQTGVNRFNTRVTLENGVVTGWDQK